MEYKRVIRFQYYHILCKKRGRDNKFGDFGAFNLVEWIVKMNTEKNIQKTIEYNRVLARIDEVGHDKNTDLWCLRLMKLRDTNIPTKVKENAESEAFVLEDDEYIGEDVTIVYDKKSSIAMIQANRFSLGISRIEELLNYTNNNENVRIYIQPILMDKNFGRLRKCNYKRIDISFANLGSWQEKDGEEAVSLARLINPMKSIGGYSGQVSISLGYVKNGALDRVQSNKLVDEILSNKRFIRSAKVKVREDDDTDVEIVDLFDEVYHDFIEFTLQSKTALGFREAVSSMVYYFNRIKQELYSAVGYSEGIE